MNNDEAVLEFPYRPRGAAVLGGAAFFALLAALGGALTLVDDDGVPMRFFGFAVTFHGAAITIALVSGIFCLLLLRVLLRTRTNTLRLTRSHLTIENPYKTSSIPLADITTMDVEVIGKERHLVIGHPGGTLRIQQLFMPTEADFDKLHSRMHEMKGA